ncbi:DUF4232 domain-containing protein [Streptomyces sp. NBC_01340]|uniref:DUF4232 domain-containing protein n=1 Tax=unclassified Streptomyces TaxID=2593676 RepID=UPI00224FC0AC|nr:MULTISPECIES: DUF4232 domain-containing protein [unclassified Streptomyces]MCX4459299.1 DUF4232 domain-containing protein [Streptomyces sp. NBC_01719]MCX4498656.1 DUF4232 domain-containing protein [Streptomyces sp. NBC_01728]WSI43134.1 DUF4232 domain-containing protein [Streptomyces sp. NBC_01340]
MHIRPALALPAVAVVLLLAVPQSGSAAARPAGCTEKAVTIHAHRSADPTLLHLGVTNHSSRACTVDRIPTVVFGDLDGAALPVPAGQSGLYRLEAGRTAYAALRTIADPADPEARRVESIGVSADPSRFGRTFTARELGVGRVVLVWEPVTSWWKSSQAAADRALR